MPKTITKLTPEQEAQMPAWAEKWIEIGFQTGQTDWARAEQTILDIYDLAKKTAPKKILRTSSPSAGSRLASVLAHAIKHNEIGKRHRDLLPDIQDFGVNPNVCADAEVTVSRLEWYGGQFWAGFAAYFSFFTDVCDWEPEEKAARGGACYRGMVESACYFWFHEEFAMVCARPMELHREDGQIHHDGGPAIVWPDGWGVYYLHGVRVPKWLAETPAEQIDPRQFTKLDNEEVSREFLRKVGPERVYGALGGTVLDEATYTNETGSHPYKLILLRNLPYLWMENPSLEGIIHMERVPLGTQTVREAHFYRWGLSEKQIDEEKGVDFIVQGDVVLKPKGATKFKSFPRLLK